MCVCVCVNTYAGLYVRQECRNCPSRTHLTIGLITVHRVYLRPGYYELCNKSSLVFSPTVSKSNFTLERLHEGDVNQSLPDMGRMVAGR